MVEPNVTTMVIKVDLQCHKCNKKIKKVLCKFPQIRDQVYDEKKNTVTIKVVCCSPEKIKQKICYKGGESVKGIEIIVPKPPPPTTFKSTETAKQKDQTLKKTEPAPSHDPPPVQEAASPIGVCCTECSEGRGGGLCYRECGFPSSPAEKSTETTKPKETPRKTNPTPSYPPLVSAAASPMGVCCTECSQGRGGGPCYRGCGFSPPTDKPTETAKPKETPKKKEPTPCYPPLIPIAAFPIGVCCTECSQGRGGGPCYHEYGFPPPTDKPTETAKPKETPKKKEPHPPLVPIAAFPIGVCCTECSQGRGGGPCYHGYGFSTPTDKPTETAKPKEPAKKKEPIPSYPPLVPIAAFPIGVCCMECSEGRDGGPCYRGYGYPPPRFYEGYCGRPVYDNWNDGYRGGYYACEENASACSIM